MIAEAAGAVVGSCPIVLCGSRATGEAVPASDWDVVVVLPLMRIPFTLRRLQRVAARLERELATPVSLQPMPAARLARRRQRNLFAWKLAREGRVLAAPSGWQLPDPGPPPPAERFAFSYLLSAVLFLLSSRESASARKAVQHVAQLRLLRTGRYASTLRGALDELGDVALAAASEDWAAARSAVLADLDAADVPAGFRRAAATNLRYLAISALRRRLRVRATASRQPIDVRLARAAILLLDTPEQTEAVAARTALPPPLRPAGEDWVSIRDTILSEWSCAHPVSAQ